MYGKNRHNFYPNIIIDTQSPIIESFTATATGAAYDGTRYLVKEGDTIEFEVRANEWIEAVGTPGFGVKGYAWPSTGNTAYTSYTVTKGDAGPVSPVLTLTDRTGINKVTITAAQLSGAGIYADTQAPQLLGAVMIDGKTMVLPFSEAVAGAADPSSYQLSPPARVVDTDVSYNNVTLTLDPPPAPGSTISISVTGEVTDLAGNALAGSAAEAVVPGQAEAPEPKDAEAPAITDLSISTVQLHTECSWPGCDPTWSPNAVASPGYAVAGSAILIEYEASEQVAKGTISMFGKNTSLNAGGATLIEVPAEAEGGAYDGPVSFSMSVEDHIGNANQGITEADLTGADDPKRQQQEFYPNILLDTQAPDLKYFNATAHGAIYNGTHYLVNEGDLVEIKIQADEEIRISGHPGFGSSAKLRWSQPGDGAAFINYGIRGGDSGAIAPDISISDLTGGMTADVPPEDKKRGKFAAHYVIPTNERAVTAADLDFGANIYADTQAPQLLAAETIGNRGLALHFSEAVAGRASSPSSYEISADSARITGANVSGSTVTLVLGSALPADARITVSDKVTDQAGNALKIRHATVGQEARQPDQRTEDKETESPDRDPEDRAAVEVRGFADEHEYEHDIELSVAESHTQVHENGSQSTVLPEIMVKKDAVLVHIRNDTVLSSNSTEPVLYVATAKSVPAVGLPDVDHAGAVSVTVGRNDTDYTVTDHSIRIDFDSTAFEQPAVFYVPSSGKAYEIAQCAAGHGITDHASAYRHIEASQYGSCHVEAEHAGGSTITIWTNHLTEFGIANRTEARGGDDCTDCNAPTIGRAASGAQMVSGGFSFNGQTVDAGRYHTPSPLITAQVGQENTVKVKVHENYGPSHVKRVELALGVPEVGAWYDAEAFIEVWLERPGIAVKGITIDDPLNLIEDSTVSAETSEASCSAAGEKQCLHLEVVYAYREAPAYSTMGVKPVDFAGYAHQFYFNDGIDVQGDSLNQPAETDVAASHASHHPVKSGLIHLVQVDRAAGLWEDKFGITWHIRDGMVRQLTVLEHAAPNDNEPGIMHGPDRHHPLFADRLASEHADALAAREAMDGAPAPKEAPAAAQQAAPPQDRRSGPEFEARMGAEGLRAETALDALYLETYGPGYSVAKQ